MFEIVENMNLAWDCFSGNYFVLLRHVASSVNLSLVVYLQLYLDAFVLRRPGCTSISTYHSSLSQSSRVCALVRKASLSGGVYDLIFWLLASSFIFIEAFAVLTSILAALQRNFYLDQLKVILFVIWSMSTNQKALDRPVAVVRDVSCRHPLYRKTWPG
jgi:hypothetical protein